MSGQQNPHYPYGAANTGYPPEPPGAPTPPAPGVVPAPAWQPDMVPQQGAELQRPSAPYQVGTILAPLPSGIVSPGPHIHPGSAHPMHSQVPILANPNQLAGQQYPPQPSHGVVEASSTDPGIAHPGGPNQGGIGDSQENWYYHTPFASAAEQELQFSLFEALREERRTLSATEAARNRAQELQSLIFLERFPQNPSAPANRTTSLASPPPAGGVTSDSLNMTRPDRAGAPASSNMQRGDPRQRPSRGRAPRYPNDVDNPTQLHQKQQGSRTSSNPEQQPNEERVDNSERASSIRELGCILCRENPATVQHPILTGGAFICEPCFNDALLAAAQVIASQQRNP